MAVLAGACLLSIPAYSAEPAKQPSKIGIHLLSSYSKGTKTLVKANLPVMKVMDLNPDMRKAVVDYKKLHPKGVVVFRKYTPFPANSYDGPVKPNIAMPYKREQNPEECGRDYWYNKLVPELEKATPAERQLIDYVEGPNEGSDCPTWRTLKDAEWFNRFWLALSPLIHEAGYKPLLASIAVGNPPGSPEEMAAKIGAFVPALRQAKKYGGAWGYHSYTIEYTKDPGVEHWYSLRYHQFYDIFKKDYPDLSDMKLILSEGGVDKGGNRLEDGWQQRGTPEKYLDWLAWFDSEIKRDPYVIGITIFAIGDDWWKSFNLEPLADKLADYLGK